jgi:hypothetical protein
MQDDSDSTELEYVDFAYCGKIIPTGPERPMRGIDELRLWTLTDDIARAVSKMTTQTAYDEYLHLGCCA